MLLVNLRALLTRKSAIENRKMTYKTVEEEIGIKALTLSRIATNHNYNFTRGDLEKLLIYFNCQPNDLLTLIREEKNPLPKDKDYTVEKFGVVDFTSITDV